MCEKTDKLLQNFDKFQQAVISTMSHNEELREFKVLGTLAISGGRDVVYVSDIETNEILYMNEVAINEFGDGLGKQCYEVFHDLKEPCKFCTNKIIRKQLDTPYYWPFYNKKSKDLYFIKDTATIHKGRLIRFEQATNLNGEVKEIHSIINKYKLF